ncbi:MAG TPA: hypothetical protein VN379_11410 [Sporomusa sp.]|nr:hypothetical protein [Sporomusa sp.]
MVHTAETGHSMNRDKAKDFARNQSMFDDEQLDHVLNIKEERK